MSLAIDTPDNVQVPQWLRTVTIIQLRDVMKHFNIHVSYRLTRTFRQCAIIIWDEEKTNPGLWTRMRDYHLLSYSLTHEGWQKCVLKLQAVRAALNTRTNFMVESQETGSMDEIGPLLHTCLGMMNSDILKAYLTALYVIFIAKWNKNVEIFANITKKVCEILHIPVTEENACKLADVWPTLTIDFPDTHKLKYHCFNTFFAIRLLGGDYNYNDVKKWSKKANVRILELDKLLIPIHINGSHWTCCVVNFELRRIEYYDSMSGKHDELMAKMRRYVQDEAAEYSGIRHLKMDDWTHLTVKQIPTQTNGFDCGMFVIKYMDYITERLDFNFNQNNINYFRKRMANELANMHVM